MMHTYIFIALLTIFAATNSNADSFRLFHDLKGRKIEVRLLDYNPETNEAKVELKNKTIKHVDVSIFSESDQAYILKWNKTKVFRSESALRISAEKDVINAESIKCGKETDNTGQWISRDPLASMKVRDVIYQLKLKNNSGVDLNGLLLKYCIYYESTLQESTTTSVTDPSRQDEHGRPLSYWTSSVPSPKKTTINTILDSWSVSELPNRKTVQTSTKTVRLKEGKECQNKTDGNKNNRDVKDELIGIRIRIYENSKPEKNLLKEVCFSEKKTSLPDWPINKTN